MCGDPARLNLTRKVIVSAAAAGFDRDDIAAIVRSMRGAHFYKSMTAYGDYCRWQDVYHVPWGNLVAYLKFADDVLSQFLVLSFKER